jgi:glutamyl-tRNA reductase
MLPDQIICIGVNHETAPVAVREELACLPPRFGSLITARIPQVHEWALISTCNRVELYVVAAAGEDAAPALVALFAEAHGNVPAALQHHLYLLRDDEAAGHLLRVAAGLDSLVLGEPQILGQVNRAFALAQEQGGAGPVLTAVFRAAISAGKRVRSETAIGQWPASVPSVAIAQAREALGGLVEREILLVGAGAMAHTAVKALRARGYEHVHVANRTRSRAAALVAAWGGTAYGLEELPQALRRADVVFCATHAGAPLITAGMVRQVMAERTERPLLLFDLAVPRDVEEAVGTLPDVCLVSLDDLQSTLDESLQQRQGAVPAAEAILAAEQLRLEGQLAELSVRPVIAGLRQKAEAIRCRELARALRRLDGLDEETLAQITHLSQTLVNQLLHEPTLRLRAEAVNGEPTYYATAVRDLFNLDALEERGPS